MKKNGKITKQ